MCKPLQSGAFSTECCISVAIYWGARRGAGVWVGGGGSARTLLVTPQGVTLETFCKQGLDHAEGLLGNTPFAPDPRSNVLRLVFVFSKFLSSHESTQA